MTGYRIKSFLIAQSLNQIEKAARRPGDGAGERAAALRGFVETLGRRLQKGQISLNETLEEVEKKPFAGRSR